MATPSDAFTQILGYVAGALTTLSFIPQVVQSWKTRSTEGLSLVMLVAFNIGIAAWVAYGAMTGAWPVFAANAVTLALSLTLLGLKIRHR